MKGGTLQINWHGTKPVLTLDFHPISGILATGGADFDIKIWNIDSGEAQKKLPTASYQTSLSYHSSAVNVLRFSPCGEYLASGADGGELLLWKMQSTDSGKTWKVLKTLSFHRKDVLDLEWSSDGAFLISGSVDNSCLIWDINKGSVHQILDAHLHYVQGVAWDPLSKYVASLSSDRTCRIYVHKTQKTKGIEKINFVCQHVISKSEQQNADDPKSLRNHLFHDETLPSFFRRLAWSPDGSCLLVPAGSYKFSASMSINTAYVFSRKDLTRPALMLPGGNKPVVAVRFSPLAFSLSGTNSAEFFKLPYQLIFAIATLNSLYIYSSESATPITIYAGLHYAPITDIAWSPDAKYLAVSSQDGYCTLIEFEKGELGTPISLKDEKKVASADSKSPVGPKPEETKMEAVTGSFSAPVECKNADERVGKREVPSATSTSVPAVSSCSVPVDGQKADEKAGQQEFPSATSTPVPAVSGCSVPIDGKKADEKAGKQEVLSARSTPVPAVSSCSVPVDGKKADEKAGKQEVLSATSTPVPAVSSCSVPVDGKKADEKAGMQEVQSATSTPVPAVSGCSVTVDSKKADENAGKQEVPTAASTTVPSKPAKRRITPMAVDP